MYALKTLRKQYWQGTASLYIQYKGKNVSLGSLSYISD